MKVTRRTLLKSAAATVALAACAPLAKVAAPVEAAPAVVKAGSWGYSLDGGYEWSPGFASRAQAMAEAAGYDVSHIQTGYCTPWPFSYPDAENIAQWLEDGNQCSLGVFIADAFAGCNEDCDWEGGLSDAISSSETSALDLAARSALADALLRHGAVEASAEVLAWEHGAAEIFPDEMPDGLYTALVADKGLEAAIEAAVRQWVDENGIEDAPRTLDIAQTQDHGAQDDEDDQAA